MYKVIRSFYDGKDNNRGYNIGDTYPRKGLEVSAERYELLASKNNNIGVPVIEEVKENKVVHEENIVKDDDGIRIAQPKWKKK